MGFHNVKEIVNLDVLIIRTHTHWRRTIDIGGDVSVPPEPGIRTSETDDRRWLESPHGLHIRLDDP